MCDGAGSIPITDGSKLAATVQGFGRVHLRQLRTTALKGFERILKIRLPPSIDGLKRLADGNRVNLGLRYHGGVDGCGTARVDRPAGVRWR